MKIVLKTGIFNIFRKDVVAIFIRGSENEFSGWPDGNKPAILFSKYKGYIFYLWRFYLKYNDTPENSKTT